MVKKEFLINNGERLKSTDFAMMLTGFLEGVTLTIIASVCSGNRQHNVIGPKNGCPVDPIIGYGVTTFDEAIEWGLEVGTTPCDLNADGTFTAAVIDPLAVLRWALLSYLSPSACSSAKVDVNTVYPALTVPGEQCLRIHEAHGIAEPVRGV